MNDYSKTKGTTIFYGDVGDGDEVDTPLAGIDSIGGLPGPEFDDIDTTRVDQSGTAREFASGWANHGQFEAVFGFSKSQVAELHSIDGEDHGFMIVFSDGSTATFDGYVKRVGGEAEKDGEIKIPVVVKVSGAVTFTEFVPPEP
jgi:hypothetical protein